MVSVQNSRFWGGGVAGSSSTIAQYVGLNNRVDHQLSGWSSATNELSDLLLASATLVRHQQIGDTFYGQNHPAICEYNPRLGTPPIHQDRR